MGKSRVRRTGLVLAIISIVQLLWLKRSSLPQCSGFLQNSVCDVSRTMIRILMTLMSKWPEQISLSRDRDYTIRNPKFWPLGNQQIGLWEKNNARSAVNSCLSTYICFNKNIIITVPKAQVRKLFRALTSLQFSIKMHGKIIFWIGSLYSSLSEW